MIKKLSILMIVFFLMITLISCNTGKTKNNTLSEKDITTESIDEIGDEMNTKSDKHSDDVTSHEISELLSHTYQFPRHNIFIDIPDFNDIESGYTRIYKDGDSKYITFSCFIDSMASGAKEAFDVSYPMFKNNVKSWHRINKETFTSTELVEINGISAQKVIGTVEYGALDKYDCYLYGYGFIFEGVPCAIIGVVSDIAQPQEEIDSLMAIVDAMMESVRNEQ